MATQFHGDPLLTTEDSASLRSLVKDQKDKNAMRGNGGGGRTTGVRGGKVGNGAPRASTKKQGASGKSVSGSSQLIASSVSSGLVSNVAKMATLRRTARNLEVTMPPAVVVPSGCILPPALQAGVSDYFNHKITDIQLLDKFEGGMVSEDDDGLAIMFEADSEIESKLTGTLKSHVSAWVHIGAGEFALSVIKNGYIPKLGAMPTFYAESNNKSYHENVDFANDAVMKLLNAGVVEEVHRSSLRCVNPLTVVQNTAKKRLCIDLSRCFNMQCEAQKFKIESTAQALASIDPDDYMFSFDLKSAYLQVPVNSNYWPYLGFSIKTSSNKGMQEHHFWYKMLPFGLNDAARVLTKLLRSPIKHWRSQGISVFLHIDDGFSCANSREQALKNSNTVRSDLISLGLLISEENAAGGLENS